MQTSDHRQHLQPALRALQAASRGRGLGQFVLVHLAASLAWSSDLDGAIGSGAGFSTTVLTVGTHTITASVVDSLGAGASDQIAVTVNVNAPPVVSITTPADGTTILLPRTSIFPIVPS